MNAISNCTQNLELKPAPSIEARTLAARLARKQSSGSKPLSVEDIRNELAQEFAPRCDRARDRFAPKISHQLVGGVCCMIIEPKQGHVKGTILYLFGGGFVSGAPDFELPIAAFLSDNCGMRVVLPYYSLAPENPYPTARTEVTSVYSALATSGEGDITLCGESSGGGLALSMIGVLRRRQIDMPNGLCLFSPWVDLTETGMAKCKQVQDPSTDIAFLSTCVQAYCAAPDRTLASPVYDTISDTFPKTYISTGSHDIMRPTLDDMADALTTADIEVQMKIWPGMWHVFELYDELPEAKTALDQAASFISNLKRGDA